MINNGNLLKNQKQDSMANDELCNRFSTFFDNANEALNSVKKAFNEAGEQSSLNQLQNRGRPAGNSSAKQRASYNNSFADKAYFTNYNQYVTAIKTLTIATQNLKDC